MENKKYKTARFKESAYLSRFGERLRREYKRAEIEKTRRIVTIGVNGVRKR